MKAEFRIPRCEYLCGVAPCPGIGCPADEDEVKQCLDEICEVLMSKDGHTQYQELWAHIGLRMPDYFKWSAQYGYPRILSWICAAFRLSAPGEHGRVPIYVLDSFVAAARNGHVGILSYLAKKFCLTLGDIQPRGDAGLSRSHSPAFDAAVAEGHTQVVQWLCKAYDITLCNSSAAIFAALKAATDRGHDDLHRWLTDKIDSALANAATFADRRFCSARAQ